MARPAAVLSLLVDYGPRHTRAGGHRLVQVHGERACGDVQHCRADVDPGPVLLQRGQVLVIAWRHDCYVGS